MKLTEKLDTRTVENLQGQGAGPKTVEALMRLATASASLTAPPPTIAAPKPKPLDPPSYEEQQKVLDAAREYALNYTKNLPDYICLEVTLRYYDPHYRPGTDRLLGGCRQTGGETHLLRSEGKIRTDQPEQ